MEIKLFIGNIVWMIRTVKIIPFGPDTSKIDNLSCCSCQYPISIQSDGESRKGQDKDIFFLKMRVFIYWKCFSFFLEVVPNARQRNLVYRCSWALGEGRQLERSQRHTRKDWVVRLLSEGWRDSHYRSCVETTSWFTLFHLTRIGAKLMFRIILYIVLHIKLPLAITSNMEKIALMGGGESWL